MKIEDVKKMESQDLKTILVSIRISKNKSKWLRENNVSPSMVLNKAIEELQAQKK